MPIALEPGQRYPIVLDSDKDKQPAPTFYAKSQSMRGQQRISACLERWNEAGATVEQLFSETIAVLSDVLIGWSDMGREYSAEAIADVLTYSEAREILRKVMFNSHIDADAKKN